MIRYIIDTTYKMSCMICGARWSSKEILKNNQEYTWCPACGHKTEMVKPITIPKET